MEGLKMSCFITATGLWKLEILIQRAGVYVPKWLRDSVSNLVRSAHVGSNPVV